MWSYTLLPKILNMSLTGAIVIALVLLIRLPLRKAPKLFSYALWAVVLFRLLCPVSFSSDFSLLNLFNSPTVTENSITYIPTDIAHNVNQQVNLPISGVSNAVNEALTQNEKQTAANPLEEPMAIATLLWLLGIAAMLICSVISLLKLKRKLTGAVWLRDNIYLADHIATPFVIGVIRPRIYLPSTLSERERDYIILHEQTHIRRLDHIVKLVAFLALTIHWFNPLVWIAFMCCMKDMEMSCDEAVMKKMGDGIRADYSASLLSLATGRKILAGAPLAFGEGDTKSRIKNVLHYKRPAFWIVVVVGLAVIALCVGLMANPRHNKIMVNDTLYEQSGETITELPSGSFEIGILESVLHSRNVTPERNFQGVGMNAKYAGNYIYQSGTDNAVIYLEDLSGFYIPFTKVQSGSTSDSSDTQPAAEASTAEPLTFTSDETDLVKLGTLAFDTYMDYLASKKTPIEERIASYKLNDISVLAGDINEFCAAIDYDIMTDSDSYLNAALGAQGKGTWTDNYMEIRIKYAYDNVYSIKGVGTGGGAQGLAPYVSESSGTGDSSATAAQAQAVLDSVVSGETAAMTLTAADGVGGGRYEVPSEPNRVSGYDSSFNWSYAESGASPSPEPAYSLKVESPDGTAAVQCWQGSDLVFCTLDGETFWLSAGVLGSDAVFDGTIFTALRSWYDEAEISGLRGDIVIPEQGQSDQEIARAWADAYENAMLRVTPGSRYACTYVKTTASINEDAMDSWYPDKALETEHFYFSYTTVFVPENDRAQNWLMAGNTIDYEGSDAPSGALEYFHMGPMYLTEKGWRCDGAGTGP